MQHTKHFHGFFCACRSKTMKKSLRERHDGISTSYCMPVSFACSSHWLTYWATSAQHWLTFNNVSLPAEISPGLFTQASPDGDALCLNIFIVFCIYFFDGTHHFWLGMFGKSQFIWERAISLDHYFNASGQLLRLWWDQTCAASAEGLRKSLSRANERSPVWLLSPSRLVWKLRSSVGFLVFSLGGPEVRSLSREIVYGRINYSYSIKLLDYRLVNMCADVSYV